jgi:hypothetical protein
MLRHHRRTIGVILSLNFATLSCSDAVVSPTGLDPATGRTNSNLSRQPSPFACYIRDLGPDGNYRYARLSLWPADADRANGARQVFVAHWKDNNGSVTSIASCSVPHTPAALEFLRRVLFITPSRHNPSALRPSLSCSGEVGGTADCGTVYMNSSPPWGNYYGGSSYEGGDGDASMGPWFPSNESWGCDPQTDPACEEPLTPTDTTTLNSSFRDYLRNPAEIPDTTARRECEEMKTWFDNMVRDKKVFRGSSTTAANDPHTKPHYGAYDPVTGNMHFEPYVLDSAAMGIPRWMNEVVNTALHEAAHAYGKEHPSGYMDMGIYQIYSDPYFSRLSPGNNTTCLKW